ncbi:MAG: DUF6443 domain-containing protein, partial [Ferruginibacter sp.]
MVSNTIFLTLVNTNVVIKRLQALAGKLNKAPFIALLCLFVMHNNCIANGNDGGIHDKQGGIPLTGIVDVTNSGGPNSSNALVKFATSVAQYVPVANEQANTAITNIISLQLREEARIYIQQDFSVTINVAISYGPSAGNVITINQPLTIDYKKDAGTTYKSKDYYVLKDAKYVSIQVTNDIVSTPQNIFANGTHLEDVLMLTNEMAITRYLNFDAANSTINFNPGPVFKEDELGVSWQSNPSAGNNGFQLEWLWVEDELAQSGISDALLFGNNSTRIDLPYNKFNYDIPLFYDGNGKLYYRIRAVSYGSDGTRQDGNWTSISFQPPPSAVDNNFNGHQPNLNWQVTTSFAEEGKRKTVVQYYDGSLRSRQTVTKDNSTNTVVTAETFYDGEGRPAIQILPSPSMESVVKYRANLNIFNGQSSDMEPGEVFDLKPSIYSSTLTEPLQLTTGGTAQYYSSSNPEKNIGSNKNIPDAELYPYTETVYTPDATGRIQAQGGVGSNHQINTGKETKYYYGQPAQVELDALFGTEVGDATHYFKNMVRDANGQVSVSYVDMHGRTIATALAGDSPGNLVPLTHPAGQTQVRNLINNTTNIVKANTIESVNTILVSAPTMYNFEYQLTPEALQLDNCANASPASLCYECRYDLEISITDESGNTPTIIRKFSNIGVTTDDCNAVPNNFSVLSTGAASQINTVNDITFQELLEIGSYSVRKTLTVNEQSLEAYKALYLTKAMCKTEQELYDSVYNVMAASSACAVPVVVTCTTCLAGLGTEADFKDASLQSLGITEQNASQEMLDQIIADYNSNKASCLLLCDNKSHELETIRQMMLDDMAPYTGQYSQETAPATSSHTMFDKYNVLPASPVSINNHPEYARLVFAENNIQNTPNGSNCYDWINNFSNAGYNDALIPSNGYLDPLTNDPFWTVAPGMKTRMINTIANYGGSNTSMWQIAFGDVKCKTIGDDAQRADCYTKMPTTSNGFNTISPAFTAAERDQVWDIFKGLYTAQRILLVNEFIATAIPLPPGDETDLIDQGYRIWFPRDDQQVAAQIAVQNNETPFWATGTQPYTTNSVTLPQNAASPYDSRCGSYINMWKDRLLECPEFTGRSDADDIVTEITNAMQVVCVNGSDESNPYGSSTVSPGTSPSFTDRSFEDVIIRVFKAHNIIGQDGKYTENYCNPFVIDWPKPYGQSPKLFDGEVTGMIDSCGCDKFSKLQSEALSQNYDPASYTSFNDFLKNVYEDSVTITIFEGLQHCQAPAGCSNCDELQNVIQGYYASNPVSSTDSCANYPTLLSSNSRINNTPAKYEASVSIEFLPGFETGVNDDFVTDIHDCVFAGDCQAQFTQYFNIYFGYTPAYTWQQINTLYINSGLPVPDICDTNKLSCTKLRQLECLFRSQSTASQIASRSSVDCRTDFTAFFNAYFHNTLNYSWQNIVDVYSRYSCDNNLEYNICDDNGIVPGGCGATVFQPIVLPHVEPLPDILKCGSVNVNHCLSCAALSNYLIEFKLAFGNMQPVFTGINELTGTEVEINKSFARFLNYRTGFQFTWMDYAKAADSTGCNLDNYQNNSAATQDVICGSAKPLNDASAYTPPGPCDKIEEQATAIAKSIYTIRQQYLLDEMEKAYSQKCLGAKDNEKFTVTYVNTEYHYTLYYYDMAGNLLKTVAPAGVHPVNNTNLSFSVYSGSTGTVSTMTGADFHTLVNASRQSNYDDQYVPVHQFKTNYRYNSLNQVVTQNTPDANTSNFWYDNLGRLVVSQNAKQLAEGKYSYSLYDDLGRIKEVGQKPQTTAITQAISQNKTDLKDWIYNNINNKEQVTRTTYDIQSPIVNPPPATAEIDQQNLRNRVSFTQYFDNDPDNGSEVVNPGDANNIDYASATYYSYDVHGNVDVLLQDYKGLPAMYVANDPAKPNRFKKITYGYDLISGKVNDVMYQPGMADAFYHHYDYDAENRLIAVKTSRDQIVWEKDAGYEYYKHGPLARTILGDQQVQGIDYAYTLHGWLKGINSTSLNTQNDIGQDGAMGSPVAKDVFGFALHYYDDGNNALDYTPIGGTALNSFAKPASSIGFAATSLFNGNIAGITINNGGLAKGPAATTNAAPLFYHYRYDQLNRIVSMQPYKNIDIANNTWPAGTTTAITDYAENISYDPNGNIVNYTRNGANGLTPPAGYTGGQAMDQMHYKYYYYDAVGNRQTYTPGAGTPTGVNLTNQLAAVNDDVAGDKYAEDIDNQTDADNYTYDAIGNLTGDKQEGITNIEWTVYGKIKQITKVKNQITSFISYTYDASCNRISKTASGITTIYVRDASGNVMSVYEQGNTNVNSGNITQSEVHLYGSSRLGIYNVKLDATTLAQNTTGLYNFERGKKFFELSNHLGNVLVTVSDKKIGVDG